MHVQIVARNGAVFAEDPGDDAEIGRGGHGGEADGDAGLLAGVGQGDGLQVADFAVGGESKRQEVGAFVDIGDQQVDAEVAELIAIIDEPVDDGLGIFGGDDGSVVGTDLFASDDFDAPGVVRGGFGDPVEGTEERWETAASVVLEIALEAGLGRPLQLVEDLIVTDRQFGHRGHR